MLLFYPAASCEEFFRLNDAKISYIIFTPSKKVTQAVAMHIGDSYFADVNLTEKGVYKIACHVKSGGKKGVVKFYV